MSNINFTGRFTINTSELSKLSFLQKTRFFKQKDALVDEFCKQGTSFTKIQNGFLLDIKDEKETAFLAVAKQLGLIFNKIK